jgi:serine kinase of HPr protein (carbohydrate metabolism regulator)
MPEVEVHASAVVIGEAGVLIRGASGAGKSRLALALMAGADEAGVFARLIGDDRTRLESCNGRLIARGHPLILGQIEQRGAGIVREIFISAAVVRLVVDIVAADKATRYPESAGECAEWRSAEWDFSGLGCVTCAGVTLPSLVAPDSAAAADLAVAILRRFLLKNSSHAASRRARLPNDP